MIETREIDEEKHRLCREVLDDLPEWFGIPAAKDAYVAAALELPMLAAFVDGEPGGFMSLKRHTVRAGELYVLGVKRRFHRQGIGRALLAAAETFAGTEGLSFLTVKTLAASNPDPQYAATRAFYEAMGFVPIEVFPTLWDPRHPCLLMIKGVGQ